MLPAAAPAGVAPDRETGLAIYFEQVFESGSAAPGIDAVMAAYERDGFRPIWTGGDSLVRALFARTRRTFSHGCTRVKEPERLAEVLLRRRPGWPLARIEQVIESGERTVVPVKAPVPIQLAYITAWANKDGTVNFRDDVYGRDAALARALLGAG